jgi:crotonobetainyl-CoA:carnitine CoA-transferase CaiB-like acyl-CoA transferase
MQNFIHLNRTLRDVINPAAAKLSGAEFERRLAAEDVPHGIVQRLDALHENPQAISNRTFREHVHPKAGAMREPRHAALFFGTPLSDPTPAPALGEHSDAVLAELGCGAERIAELRAAGVVA